MKSYLACCSLSLTRVDSIREKSKTKQQTQKLGFHRGTAGPKLIGCCCKYENSGFAKGSIVSFTEFVGASPVTFAKAFRHLSGNFGRYEAGGVHRLYGREIDEIMQEEETEKLGQAGRTGELFDLAVSYVSLASMSQSMQGVKHKRNRNNKQRNSAHSRTVFGYSVIIWKLVVLIVDLCLFTAVS